MRRYKVVPPMYRRNRPMAGFPVLNPRRGGRASKSPKNAQSAADTLIGSLRRASLSPYVGMIQIRSRVKTMAVSSQPGNTDSPLFSSVYCTPLFQILQPFPTKTGGVLPVFPHRFTEMALTGQPLAASNTRLSRFFSGAPVTRDTRPTMANTSGTTAAHIPQPMHRLSSILICIRVSSSVCSGLVGAVFPHYSLLRRSPTRPFSCRELFGRCFVRKKEHFSGRNGGFVSGSAFTLSLFCAILKNVMLTTLETDGGSL